MTTEKQEGLCGHNLNYVCSWYRLFPVKFSDQSQATGELMTHIFLKPQNDLAHMKNLKLKFYLFSSLIFFLEKLKG